MNPFRKDDWIQFGKQRWWQIVLVQALLLFGAGIVASRLIFPAAESSAVEDASSVASGGEAKPSGPQSGSGSDSQPKWWTCAMHPQIRQQEPGHCPICQMKLVPVKSSAGGLRTLTIKPAVKELMKVTTSPVERRYVTANVRMVGKIDYDQTRLAHITAWVAGRLDRLYVDYAGVQVKEGDHMVYIYSEELYSIQEELIRALNFQRENRGAGGRDLAKAARQKLRLLGLNDEQIKNMERREQPQTHATIYAPRGGIVIEKLKQEGDRVQTGDRIYTVADLNYLWVMLDAYASDLQWIRYGQSVSFTTEAYPGESFQGRIAFIDPVLNRHTRTVKVRVNVRNNDGRLKPEMFVRATVESNVAAGGRVLDADLAGKWISPMHPEIVKDQPGVCDICGMPLVRAESLGYVAPDADPAAKPLVIPASAVLKTGTRAIVYVEVPGAAEPTYEGREVLLGPRAGDHYLVRNGLFDGEQVVTNGNFKIDSALQIQAKPTMMTPAGAGGQGHDQGSDQGSGSRHSEVQPTTKQWDLPDPFRQQLHELISASETVVQQADTDQLENIRQAFTQFHEQLNRVNAEQLTGHPAMLWKEFLMRLGNDAIEGKEANDLTTAARVRSSLQNNIAQMMNQFRLKRSRQGNPKTKPPVKLKVSDELRAQLGVLAQAYWQLQTSLAADSNDQIGSAVNAIQKAFTAIDASQLQGEARAQWSQEGTQLQQAIGQLGQAQDMTETRAEFALLSEQLLVVLQKFGAKGVDVYELHCPMAFDGRGATWLQKHDQPQNPYFGQSMLGCADRIRKVDVTTDAENPGGELGHE